MEIKEALDILKGICPNGFALVPLISNEKEALLTAISHLETLQKVKEAGGVKRKEIYENNYPNGWNDCLDAVHAELEGKLEGLEKNIEVLCERVHKAYCKYNLEHKGEEYWTKGDYNLLNEEGKEYDRRTVRVILEAIQDLFLGKKEE